MTSWLTFPPGTSDAGPVRIRADAILAIRPKHTGKRDNPLTIDETRLISVLVTAGDTISVDMEPDEVWTLIREAE